MLARRFLYLVALGVAIVVAAVALYTLKGDWLIRQATTPSIAFSDSPAPPPPAYDPAASTPWLARPGKPSTAAWTPPGFAPAPHPVAAVFYVAPTAFLSRARWNAPLDDAETNQRLQVYLLVQASALNGVGAIWAPAYRQATFGAFLTAKPDAARALALAYGDVARAWDAFLAANPRGPIILAGHSQGSLHLERLLAERIAGHPELIRRIVAVYMPGWPVSVEADLPAMGLPACSSPDQTGCILDWMTYADPADPSTFREVIERTPGLTGRARGGTHLLCVNPLLGRTGLEGAPLATDLGALRPGAALTDLPSLEPRAVPARCDARGLLLIGAPPPGYGNFIMPGGNYHVYDYNLFWANIRADAARRLAAWRARTGGGPGSAA